MNTATRPAIRSHYQRDRLRVLGRQNTLPIEETLDESPETLTQQHFEQETLSQNTERTNRRRLFPS